MKLWISLLLALFLLAAEMLVENGFAKGPDKVPLTVIDQDKANLLFRKFVQNEEIPFKFPIDGCYARAHQMAAMAEIEKVDMGKIFAEGDLQVKTDLAKYPLVQWGWHVAPVGYVKQQNGEIELMVFDPSLFKKPVKVEEWKQKMMDTTGGHRPKVRISYFGSRFQYYPRSYETYKEKWDPSDLLSVKQTIKDYQPLQDFTSLAPEIRSNLSNQEQGAW